MAQGKPLPKQTYDSARASARSGSESFRDQAKDKNASFWRAFLEQDFPLIRKALLAFGTTLMLGAALVGTSRAILLEQQDSMNRAQAQRNDTRNKYLQMETEKREAEEFQPGYKQLRELGFVGEEKRLDWVEQIKSSREKRKLLPITYEISAQQSFQIDPSVPTGDLELHGSAMKIRMGLLHELDLLNFLDDLKSKGFYTVQTCTVKRVATATASPDSPRLAAECILYWLTLGQRTSSPESAPQPGTQ